MQCVAAPSLRLPTLHVRSSARRGSSAPLRRPVQNMQHQSLIHNAQPHELLPMDEVIVQSQVEFNYPEDETAAVADDIDEFD